MLLSEDSSSFAEAHNDSALALYEQLIQTPGNLFFSPFSVRVALGMTYAGARGETAAQMRAALRFGSSDEALQVGFHDIIYRLDSDGGAKFEMAVANSLWSQDGAPLQPEFLDLVDRHYGGGVHLADFRRGAEPARRNVNRWVEDKTRQKIQELIPPGGVGADTRLVLVNAVYFRGIWVQPFDELATRVEPFYLEKGGKVPVPLMQQREEVRYARAGGFQAVDLDYQGGDLSMLVLLPDRKDGLRDLETKLSAGTLQSSVAKMSVREVELFLPKFEMTWGTVDLAPQLHALGMPIAFDSSRADFSGINGHEPPQQDALFIAAVFHKAFVDVNEEGTEAAAATGVTVTFGEALESRKPPPVPIFRADHPFLFAIRDRKSGAILFLGRVTDPN